MTDISIELRQLTLGYSANTLLRDISFRMPARGLVALMGPSGVGKSTLLRAISRMNDAQPSFWTQGEVLLDGNNLLQQQAAIVQRRLPLLVQKARLYTASVLDNLLLDLARSTDITVAAKKEYARNMLAPWQLWDEFAAVLHQPALGLSVAAHKKILIARLLDTHDVSCLLVDEPLSEVAVCEEDSLIELLQRIAQQLPVLMVTHSKPAARRISQLVCLLSGDRLIEVAATEAFFAGPKTELGREFLNCGSSWPLSAAREDTVISVHADSLGLPREFHWIIRGILAGMHRPGLWGDIDSDLQGLSVLGIKMLVTLTETPFDSTKLDGFGITGVHFPIVDMSIPTIEDTYKLCVHINAWINAGRATVLHCKAGLGRTGTMLACIQVYRGLGPARAIETVRSVQAGYIQTEEQLAFISEFANFLQCRHRFAAPS